jgi:hypothetical protein
MPIFNKNNAVLDDGIYLPSFLFYSEKPKSKNISPAASFNPAAALEGAPFKSSISPSATPRKKTLIIDRESLSKIPEYGEKIALLKRLQVAGFKIFLRTGEDEKNPFVKLEEDLSNIAVLHNLSDFDQSKDYLKLAEKGVARDTSLLIAKEKNTKSHIKEIERALKQNSPQGPWFETNDWQFEFGRFSDESEDIDPLKENSFSKLLFRLQQNLNFSEQESLVEEIKMHLSHLEKASTDISFNLSNVIKTGLLSSKNPLANISLNLPRSSRSDLALQAINSYYIENHRCDFAEYLDREYLALDKNSLMNAIEVFPERSEKFLTKYFESNENLLALAEIQRKTSKNSGRYLRRKRI